jgi:transposase
MLRNQLQTLAYARIENDTVSLGLKKIITEVEAQIKQATSAIEETLRKDPALLAKVEAINSIKGLGLISITTVIAETDGFALFENQAQLVSYSGYDVVKNQSGKRQGSTQISKKGNSRIRRILFMPAFSVVRYKVKPFSDLYDRVYRRTLVKMKAYVVVQRKLLILIYTLWKRGEKFDPDKHPEMGIRLLSFQNT